MANGNLLQSIRDRKTTSLPSESVLERIGNFFGGPLFLTKREQALQQLGDADAINKVLTGDVDLTGKKQIQKGRDVDIATKQRKLDDLGLGIPVAGTIFGREIDPETGQLPIVAQQPRSLSAFDQILAQTFDDNKKIQDPNLQLPLIDFSQPLSDAENAIAAPIIARGGTREEVSQAIMNFRAGGGNQQPVTGGATTAVPTAPAQPSVSASPQEISARALSATAGRQPSIIDAIPGFLARGRDVFSNLLESQNQPLIPAPSATNQNRIGSAIQSGVQAAQDFSQAQGVQAIASDLKIPDLTPREASLVIFMRDSKLNDDVIKNEILRRRQSLKEGFALPGGA